MPIPATCPKCGHQISAPDNLAGKKARCAKCKEILEIPVAEQLVEVGTDDPSTARAPKARGVQRRMAARKQGASTGTIIVVVVLVGVIGVFGYQALVANSELTKQNTTRPPTARGSSASAPPTNSTSAASGETVEYTHEMGMDGFLLLYEVGDYANPETLGTLKPALFLMQHGIEFDKDATKHIALSKGTLILVRKMEVASSSQDVWRDYYVRVQSGPHKGTEGWLVERYLLDR